MCSYVPLMCRCRSLHQSVLVFLLVPPGSSIFILLHVFAMTCVNVHFSANKCSICVLGSVLVWQSPSCLGAMPKADTRRAIARFKATIGQEVRQEAKDKVAAVLGDFGGLSKSKRAKFTNEVDKIVMKEVRLRWKDCSNKDAFFQAPDEVSHTDGRDWCGGVRTFTVVHRQRVLDDLRDESEAYKDMSAHALRAKVEKQCRREFMELPLTEKFVYDAAPDVGDISVGEGGRYNVKGEGGRFRSSKAILDDYFAAALGCREIDAVQQCEAGGSDCGCEACPAGDSDLDCLAGLSDEDSLVTPAKNGRGRKRKGEEQTFVDLAGSGGGRRVLKQRTSDLRSALREAVGPNGVVDDYVPALRAAMGQDEWSAFSKAVAEDYEKSTWKESPWMAWKSVGQHLCQVLEAAATTRWRWPVVAIAAAFKAAGWKTHKEVTKNFNVCISKRAWKSAGSGGILNPKAAINNGRSGWRKFSPDQLREILDAHSTDSCRFGLRRGCVGEDAVYEVKSLTSKPAGIYRAETGLAAAIQEQTLRRNIKTDHEAYRVTQRKLDCCEKCLSWDTRVERMARRTLVEIEEKMEAVMPGYWDQWCTSSKKLSSSKLEINYDVVKKVDTYIDKHKSWDGRGRKRGPGSGGWRADVKEAEVWAHGRLAAQWDLVEGDVGGEKTSMLDVMQWYGWHFTCRDVQKREYKKACNATPPGYMGVHIDFGQTRTLPVGPKEGGRWWYGLHFAISFDFVFNLLVFCLQ